MKVKILSWNVRGVNSESKRGIVRTLIQQWGADIYVLVETKLTESKVYVFRQLWQKRWMGEYHLNAIGRSGGIVVMWDKRHWKGELVEAANQMLTVKFEGIDQVLTWFLSAVYASCDTVIRRELWQGLTNIREVCDGPWVTCGDFNVTRYPHERSEGHRITRAMNEFTEWINEMEFLDPSLLGGSFTWRRGDNHRSASRIDRFLYSP